MTYEQALIRVSEIVAEKTATHVFDVKPGSELKGELDCDDLDIVLIAITIEEEFGVDIPNKDIETCKTVSELAVLAGGLLGSGSGPA